MFILALILTGWLIVGMFAVMAKVDGNRRKP
jgi:hypothetical protein